jgi:hypothetical protein
MMANSFSFDTCLPRPRRVYPASGKVFERPEDRLCSVCGLDFSINILKMRFYGKKTDVQLLRDFVIGQPLGELSDDFDFPT